MSNLTMASQAEQPHLFGNPKGRSEPQPLSHQRVGRALQPIQDTAGQLLREILRQQGAYRTYGLGYAHKQVIDDEACATAIRGEMNSMARFFTCQPLSMGAVLSRQ